MRIDAHAHYTPPSMIADLEGFAEQEPYWGLLITPDPVNHTAQGWATPERMIDDMEWRDSPVPFWEPIAQAAAAHGYGPKAQQRLLEELNEAVG
jgi:hypothetical protein